MQIKYEEDIIKQNKYGFYIDNKPKAKSRLTIGKEKNFILMIDTKFNKLQKKMWKFLLNINIEDVED